MVRGRIEINRTLFALNDEAVLQHYQRNFPLHIAKLYFYGFRSVYGHTDQKNCESNSKLLVVATKTKTPI